MGRAERRLQRKPLCETLAEIRRERAAGVKRPRKLTRFGKVGESEFITNAKGHRVERPTIYGLNWLRLFGEALKLYEVVWDVRVSTERWEQDGCVSLHLQRVVHDESAPTAVTVGAKGLVIETGAVPVGGGAWEVWRVPIGLVNNHDTAALVKLIATPKAADIIMADNRLIRAIHGR